MGIVIKVENLGKKYIISHRQERYTALRDVMTNTAKKTIKKITGKSEVLPKKEEFWALRNIDFEVNAGDRIGIIGKNGAGKSTLLKLLSKITEPTEGKIKIKGKISSLLEVGTGFHGELTGKENIMLNGAILGMSKKEILKKFDEIVEFAEIEKFLDTPVKRYSSGMYVRLGFAIAAHLEPDILIIDEVLAVGDIEFQKKCLGKMNDISSKKGRTIIFVSHNMNSISQLCQKSILLERGNIVLNDKTDIVIKKYLSKNESPRNTFEQMENKEKEINLRKVILNPDSENKSIDVLYNSDIKIRIEYEINKPVFNCTVWLFVQSMDGIHIFTTTDCDRNLELLGKRKPGYYKYDVLIPSKWLNLNEYNVVVGIVKNNPLIIYDRVETINFNIVDYDGSAPESIFGDHRIGILQPCLHWAKFDD